MKVASRRGGGLTLQHFILQSSLLQAYRAAVRATRPLPDERTRRETLDWLRGDISRLKHITDLDTLKSQLSAFNRTVKIMTPSIGLGGLTVEHGAKLIGRRGDQEPVTT